MTAPRISSFAIATSCVILILALPGCDPDGDSIGGPSRGSGGSGGRLLPVAEVLSVRISS